MRQSTLSIGFGGPSPYYGGYNRVSDASGEWWAYSFVLPTAKTLNAVRVYVASDTSGQLTGHIYDDSNGWPGSQVSGGASGTLTPAGTGWKSFTGFTCSLSAATVYWFVYKYVAGSTGIRWSGQATVNFPHTGYGSFNAPANNVLYTSDSGSNWSGSIYGCAGIRFDFSDSTYWGFPVDTYTYYYTAGAVYAAKEFGAQFTFPSNCKVSCVGLAMYPYEAGTAPDCKYRLRLNGGAPTDTQTIPNYDVTADWVPAYFSSPVTISPGDTVKATIAIGDGSSGDSSNYWHTFKFNFDSDANSADLRPFGDLASAYLDGTWSYGSNDFPPCYLILDPDTPFLSAGGGSGGLLVHPGMSGGMRG